MVLSWRLSPSETTRDPCCLREWQDSPGVKGASEQTDNPATRWLPDLGGGWLWQGRHSIAASGSSQQKRFNNKATEGCGEDEAHHTTPGPTCSSSILHGPSEL